MNGQTKHFLRFKNNKIKMARKHYYKTRIRETGKMDKTKQPLNPKYNRFEILDKAKKLMEIFPDTPIWKYLYNLVKLKIRLSVKQLDAINHMYNLCGMCHCK